MMRVLSFFTNMIFALFLCGCSANYNSIYRSKPIFGSGSLTLIDAKQRAIIDRTSRDGKSKVCTEPPPDVFSVYAQSLAASGSMSKGTDPTTLGASGSLAFSSSETGATIGRTQAYNLLALQVYYNCLSSLNGDSGELEAPIDRVRLQRLIVSTIAIEQLTGAIRPHVVVIGAGGSSSGGGSAEAMAMLAQARKDDLTATDNLNKAEGEKKKLEDDDPKCSALAARVKGGEALEKAAEITKQENCTKADAKVAGMKASSDEASKYYHAQLASAGSGMSATAEAKQIEAKVIEATSERNEETIQKIAGAVQAIVYQNFDGQDETKFFCMRLLYDNDFRKAAEQASSVGAQNLGLSCAALLLTDVEKRIDPAKLSEYKANFAAALNQITPVVTSNFDHYWSKIADGAGKPDIAKVAALLDPIINAKGTPGSTILRLTTLKTALTKEEARTAFGQVPSDLQIKLAN